MGHCRLVTLERIRENSTQSGGAYQLVHLMAEKPTGIVTPLLHQKLRIQCPSTAAAAGWDEW